MIIYIDIKEKFAKQEANFKTRREEDVVNKC